MDCDGKRRQKQACCINIFFCSIQFDSAYYQQHEYKGRILTWDPLWMFWIL